MNENGDAVAFLAYMHQPHSETRNIKRVSRLVVLPDYQGIGLGTMYLESVGRAILKEGFEYRLVTSAKNLIFALSKRKGWIAKRVGVTHQTVNNHIIGFKSARTKAKTASFKFTG